MIGIVFVFEPMYGVYGKLVVPPSPRKGCVWK